MDYHTAPNTTNNVQNYHVTTNTTNIYIISNVSSNPVQNNNPSLEETSKFLDKPKKTKKKMLSAFCTIISAVSSNQIFPQINDINLIYKSVFWLLVAVLACFFSL